MSRPLMFGKHLESRQVLLIHRTSVMKKSKSVKKKSNFDLNFFSLQLKNTDTKSGLNISCISIVVYVSSKTRNRLREKKKQTFLHDLFRSFHGKGSVQQLYCILDILG